jgi:hypothetical protein
VHVVLGLARQVEVDDLRHAGNVDAARRDIGRDERAHAAAAQAGQRAIALVLVHVTVQRCGRVAFVLQLDGQRFGIPLRRHEDDALTLADVGEQPIEQPVLVRAIVGEMDALLDRDGRRSRRTHVDAHRFARESRREPADRPVERCREQHRLPRGRRKRADPVDVFGEAHVQHAVGLVENEHLQFRQVDTPALDVVHQPAGCRDEHVDAAFDLAILRRIRRTAEHADRAEPDVLAITRRLRRHLLRELARWREHQHAGYADTAPLGGRPRALRGKPLQRGQDECRRLAGAGLRRRDDVPPAKQHRNGLRLDRRRFGIAAFGERLQKRRHEVQVFESHEFPSTDTRAAQTAAHTRRARRAYVRTRSANPDRSLDARTAAQAQMRHAGRGNAEAAATGSTSLQSHRR